MELNSRIYVAGHRGLAGGALWRELQRQGFTNLIGQSHAELDLLDAAAVRHFFAETRPEFVFVAVWDTTKPDGAPRKRIDNSRLFALGWRPQVRLAGGLRLTYEDFAQRFGQP